MSIALKLLQIQEEVDKIEKNKKGFNFEYANGDVVIGAIRPKMNELKLICYPTMRGIKVDVLDFEDNKNKKVHEYLFTSNGAFVWLDCETGEKLEVDWTFAGNNDDSSQAQGNSLTYNERYFLLKFFKISTAKDDPDAKMPKPEQPKMMLATQEDVVVADTLIMLTGADKNVILTYYKVDDLSKLTAEEIQQVIRKQKKLCTEKNIPFEEVK